MAGKSMAVAADIVVGETGELLHVPQLPERGLGSDSVGRTASLLPFLSVDLGPRGWRLTARPQLITRQMRDQMDRDLDTLQEVWGESLPRVKAQLMGPWSLAASVELANGHRVLTDRGAVADLHQALLAGAVEHRADLARRFGAEVSLQLDEPLLPQIIAGRVPGTHEFDTIPAIPAEVALARLEEFHADYLHADFLHAAPEWAVASAAPTLLVDFAGLDAPQHVDGLGQHLDAGRRVGLGLNTGDRRAAAIAVARYFDLLGHPREWLVDRVDIYPAAKLPGAKDYAFAAQVADILTRDAGDL
ncbi:methionine synthase [Corynebacterium phocae]|nr:methionine synthase [Corynebacterium phocae]